MAHLKIQLDTKREITKETGQGVEPSFRMGGGNWGRLRNPACGEKPLF